MQVGFNNPADSLNLDNRIVEHSQRLEEMRAENTLVLKRATSVMLFSANARKIDNLSKTKKLVNSNKE